MAADGGRVVLNLVLDDSDAQEQLKKLENQEAVVHVRTETEDGTKAAVQESTQAAQTAGEQIRSILQNTEMDARTKAMNISKIYQQSGMDASTALRAAWADVKGGTASGEAAVKSFGAKAKSAFTQFGQNAETSSRKAEKSLNSANTAASRLIKTLGSAFAVTKIIAFGKACITASNDATNALMGLQSIMDGQGRSFSQAQSFIDSYIADGLIPMNNAVTAYKNLASRGYDDSQIQAVMMALKDSSAYGRQASLTMGEALQSASEGLKNENSILVDNAGVTKNVAKMWEDYAKSIGTTAAKLTQEQKIQAEVNGILEETRFQTGDAAKIAQTFSGQMSRLNASFTAFKAAVGNLLTGALAPYIGYITTALEITTDFLESLGKMLGFTGGLTLGTQAASATVNVDGLTSSLEDASAAAEQLGAASFDDFNVIGTGSADNSSGSASVSTDTSGVIGTAEDTASEVGNIFESMFGDIDFTNLNAAFTELKEAFAPIGEDIGEGALWLYEEVLQPLAEWTIEDLLPAFLGVFAGALEVLDAVIDDLEPGAQWLWDEFIEPLAEWTGEIITEGLESLGDALSDIGDWIRSNPRAAAAMGAVATGILAINSALTGGAIAVGASKFVGGLSKLAGINTTVGVLIAGAAGWIYTFTEISNNWSDICDVVEESGGVFGFIAGWIEYCREDIEEFFNFGDFGARWFEFWESVGEIAYDKLTGIKTWFTDQIEEIKQIGSGLWSWFTNAMDVLIQPVIDLKDGVSEAMVGVISSFTSVVSNIIGAAKGIVNFVTGAFTGDWEKAWTGISDFFKGIWDGFVDIVKTPINLIIDLINGLTSAIESGLNGLIDGVNSISIDVPDGLSDLVGFDTIGFNLSYVTIPEIPRLATGGLVRQPTLAMVGDNPNAGRDPEVVAPLSKLRGMISDLAAASGGDERILQKLTVIIDLLTRLLGAVESIDPVVRIGDKDIYSANKRAELRAKRMKGAVI